MPRTTIDLATNALISAWTPPDGGAVSTVSVGELYAGVELARTAIERRRREQRIEAVVAHYDVLPVDLEVARAFGEVLTETCRTDGPRNRGDLLIAATAVAHGVGLATADRRLAAFARRLGLVVDEPPPDSQ